MTKVNFDKHAEDYNSIIEKDLQIFGEENSYFAEYKTKIVRELITNNPSSILDYGCGIGRNIKHLARYFPNTNIYGCDISKKSLEIASNMNPHDKFFEIKDEELEKHKGFFDLVFVSCVLHHVHPNQRNQSIKNIHSLLKSKGSLFIFEHNPYNPITNHFVSNCVFDKDAILLKPKETYELVENLDFNVQKKNYTLFFPAFLKGLRFLEKYIGFLPLGGQYYIIAVK